MMSSENQASRTETQDGYIPSDNNLTHPEDNSCQPEGSPRHPELVSGFREDSPPTAGAMKQVQDDGDLTTEDIIAAIHELSISDLGEPTQDNEPIPPSTLSPNLRAGGWNGRKMIAFLDALLETCSVSEAAASVSMSRSAAYRLRARLAGTAFDQAWELAFEQGLRQVSHAALDRAINGVLQPVFYKGEKIGERRVFNENLTWRMFNESQDPYVRIRKFEGWQGLLDQIEHDADDTKDIGNEGEL